MREIRGDHLEGGGSIIRTATALAALTQTPIRIVKIRSLRPNPGLQAQHVEGIRAVAALCDADVEGDSIGSLTVTFIPRALRKQSVVVHVGTAGSIGLILQSVALPASVHGADVRVEGGATWGKWAPPLLSSQSVLLPLLEKMKYRADIRVERDGFYPVGGAEVMFSIPQSHLHGIVLEHLGPITHVGGLSMASRLPKVAERQAHAAEVALKGLNPLIKHMDVHAHCPGSGIALWATDGTTILGSDALGERGKTSELVGKEAAVQLKNLIGTRATVDPHTSDQLLLFMAFARGSSTILVPEITRHTETNMWLIEEFVGKVFSIEKRGTLTAIHCSGRE